MSASRKPSHLTVAHGFIDIIEEESPVLPVGSQYGFYACKGTIGVGGASGDNPRDIVIKVTANTSQSNALIAGRLYSGSLRLIKPAGADTFTGYYTPKQPRSVGSSELGDDMVNQVMMMGLGVVISREEAVSGDNGDPILITEIRHTDWDSAARTTVSFDVTYITVKKGNLANSFGLFQVGRELCLTGVIIDWDELKSTWIVQTNTISVTSGHQSLKTLPGATSPQVTNSSPRKKVLVQGKSFGAKAEVGAQTNTQGDISQSCNSNLDNNASMEASTGHPPLPDLPIERVPEEGEVEDLQEPPQFQNSYAKKRTNQEVMSDARKRMKGKL